ncbi:MULTISPECIES: hypothetical protein [unclassified Microbacterium]|uniref:hypothetical protein n=1 Tax=unclassified Microbacterium TaxID=2609290 RepID=UPI00301B45EC
MSSISPDIIDRTRREVRERTYRNSTEEAAEVARVDDILFHRVGAAEQNVIDQAQSFIRANAPRVGLSLDLLEDLEDIGRRLARGGDTTALAKEYRDIKGRIDRELGVLGSLAQNADRMDAALEDPVAHAQRIYAKMPASTWVAP